MPSPRGAIHRRGPGAHPGGRRGWPRSTGAPSLAVVDVSGDWTLRSSLALRAAALRMASRRTTNRALAGGVQRAYAPLSTAAISVTAGPMSVLSVR